MTRRPDPGTRQVTKEAAIIASQRAGRTALVGLVLAVAIIVLASVT